MSERQTDPISAAASYQAALRAILEAPSLTAAQQHAARALQTTMRRATGEVTITTEAGVSHKTGAGFVVLTLPERCVQMPTEDARRVAGELARAAEAADADAFLVAFGREALALDERGAAALMARFRAWRARQAD